MGKLGEVRTDYENRIAQMREVIGRLEIENNALSIRNRKKRKL